MLKKCNRYHDRIGQSWLGLPKNNLKFGFSNFIKWKRNNSKLNWTFERSCWWKRRSPLHNTSWKHKSIQSYFDVTLSECLSKIASIWNFGFCYRFKSRSKRNNCKEFWIDGDYHWSFAKHDKSRKVNKACGFNIE